MNDLPTSRQTDDLTPRNTKTRERSQRSSRRTILLSLLTLVVWCGLASGGYALAMHHINNLQEQQAEIESNLQSQIEEARSVNSEKIDELNAELNDMASKMASVSEKLEAIREELELTSDSISGSDDTKLALQEQISELDKQLEELKDSLEKLEDAARVY